MDCQAAQNLLLQYDAREVRRGEIPAAVWDQVLRHAEQCTQCQALWKRAQLIDKAVRALPQPPGTDAARSVFERRLRDLAGQPTTEAAPRPLRLVTWVRPTLPRMAIAATLLISSSLAIWLYHEHRAKASTEVVDQLVAMNLDVAAKPSPDERKAVYASAAPSLRQKADDAPLDHADRQLVDTLVQNGAYLMTAAADPLAEADRFNDVAEQLVDQMDKAAKHGKVQALNRLGKTYCTIVDQGVNARLDHLDRLGPEAMTAERTERLTHLLQLNEAQRARLKEILAKAPAASRLQIEKALEISTKRHAPGAGNPNKKPKGPLH